MIRQIKVLFSESHLDILICYRLISSKIKAISNHASWLCYFGILYNHKKFFVYLFYAFSVFILNICVDRCIVGFRGVVQLGGLILGSPG